MQTRLNARWILLLILAPLVGAYFFIWLAGTLYEHKPYEPLRQLQQSRATENEVVTRLGAPGAIVIKGTDPRKFSLSRPASTVIRPLRSNESKILVYFGYPKLIFPRQSFIYMDHDGRVTDVVIEGT